jgi:TrmH family RNA methyltransferase
MTQSQREERPKHPVARITSRQHAVVKTFRAVARGDESRALIDGWHLLHEAAASGLTIDMVALAHPPDAPADELLIRQLEPTGALVSVTSSVMDAVSPVRTPSGVVAIVQKRQWDVASLFTAQPSLVVLAVDLQDPGNAGAVIRSAEAGGASGVILAGASTDAWNWKALRAAMGSTFRVPVFNERDPRAALARLRAAGLNVIATTPHDGAEMYDVDLAAPCVIVIGGEGPGLPPELLNHANERLRIPMAAGVESLNAAVAAAVVVYEAARQRRARRTSA